MSCDAPCVRDSGQADDKQLEGPRANVTNLLQILRPGSDALRASERSSPEVRCSFKSCGRIGYQHGQARGLSLHEHFRLFQTHYAMSRAQICL